MTVFSKLLELTEIPIWEVKISIKEFLDHFMKMIKKKDNIDISKDKRAIQKLKREVEKGKRALSAQHETKIEIEDLVEGYDFS